MLMPMLSPDSFTAFVYVLSSANHPVSDSAQCCRQKLTSADQPVSALPLDPIDGEVTLNVAAFARIATPLLLESLLQFIAVSTGHDPVSLA